MRAIEFQTEFRRGKALSIPKDIAKRFPSTGRARVIVLFEEDRDDVDWQLASYEQFMKDDASEDSVYDALKP